jgi:outer membrane protein assembly factor BamB
MSLFPRSFARFALVLIGLALALPSAAARADDWPQWLGPQRDGVWREKGLLEKFPAGGPKVLWRTPLGTGYSGPAVANGRVYVMDRQRAVGPDGKPERPSRKGILGTERVVCLDAASGKVLWKHEYECPYKVSYPSGPRTTPLVAGKRVYTLGAMGDLLCLEADTGRVVWAKNLMKAYGLDGPPVWGFAAHPLLDGERLYCIVGGPGSAVVALNKDTGREIWKALSSEEVGYSPPVLCDAGGKRQLIIWLSESVNGLDPATGAVYWTQEFPVGRPPQRPAVNIATVRCNRDRLFLTTFYHGSLMLKLDTDKPGASILWKGKSNNPARPDGLHGLMAAPVFEGDYVYGVAADGEMCCLAADTGKVLWQTLAATGGAKADCGSAFLIPQGDRFVIFNDLGDLILARLTPKGYTEIDRAHVLEPDHEARGRKVVWSHPAFARRCCFARNDKEIVCFSLAAEG